MTAKRIWISSASAHSVERVRELFPEGNAREVQPLNEREILSDLEND